MRAIQKMTTKQFNIEANFIAKSVSDKGLKIEGYANTSTKDRMDEVIVPRAWESGAEYYRKNPVLLYLHDQNKPIGRVSKIQVDPKGLFVEAYISEAAEKLYGVHTLVKDGSVKAFSVGFIPKQGKYDHKTDTTLITDLELIEISIVPVPANRDSLFSIRKSFGDDSEGYKAWKESVIKSSEDITESTEEAIVKVDMEDVPDLPVEPHKPIPFINLLSRAASNLAVGKTVKLDGLRYKVSELPTVQNQKFTLEQIDLVGNSISKNLEIDANGVDVVNIIDMDTNFDLNLIQLEYVDLTTLDKAEIQKAFKEVCTLNPTQLLQLKTDPTVKQNPLLQERLNQTIELVLDTSWTDTNYQIASKNIQLVKKLKELNESDLALQVLGVNTKSKENDMADQLAGDPIVVNTKGGTVPSDSEVVETKSVTTVEVSEPRVTELIEKTGKAILAEADASTKDGISASELASLREQVAELTQVMKKNHEQVTAVQTSKMQYAESQKREPITRRDMANAVFLGTALGLDKRNLLETKFAQDLLKTKAITTVDAFLSNFSTDLYEEMTQQLVILPMLRKMQVDAKTFRVPVADEDTDGDVAQFASGTYPTGIADSTNVPTTNQHVIKSVDFTPHKFMATTHIAKDEEEDTVLPLIDFLRQASARRLARALDKAVLRGDGTLTGFTASPTNAITAGTGYQSVMKGIVTLANDISGLRTDTTNASTKAGPSNIGAARAKLGKYGLQLGDQLVYLTTVEGYNELVQNSNFITVDKLGPQATYLTGSVGAVYGIPVMITEFLDSIGASGVNYHIGALVYKPGFLVAERRAIEIESEYDPRRQVTAVYLSTRLDMKALTTNASSALDATKYSFAVVVRSGT